MQRNAQVTNKLKIKRTKFIVFLFFCVVTAPFEVRPATPQTILVAEIPETIETIERGISPIPNEQISLMDSSTEPALSRLQNTDDHVELLKVTYEDKINKLHDSYQWVFSINFPYWSN